MRRTPCGCSLLAMTGTATPIVIAKPVRTLAVAISELPNLYNFFRLYRLPLRGRMGHAPSLQLSIESFL